MLVIRINQALHNKCMVNPIAEGTIWEYYETNLERWQIRLWISRN